MPPHELEELKVQRRQLRDRDFAYPSSLQDNGQSCLRIRMIPRMLSWTLDEEAIQKLKTLSTFAPILTKTDVTQPVDVHWRRKEKS